MINLGYQPSKGLREILQQGRLCLIYEIYHFNKQGLGYLPKIKKKYNVRTIIFFPQQKSEINPLIKINYSISKNIDKNLFTVHSEKEKGKEKLEENKTNQMRSEKN